MVRASDVSRFRQVVVSMRALGPVAHQLREAGIEVHTLGMKAGVPTVGASWRLVKLLRRSKPDLFLCWMYHANLLGLLAGKLARVPRVVWGIRCSNMDFSCQRLMTRRVVKLCASLSKLPDLIIVNSEAGRDVHAEMGYAKEKMVVIPNGIDTDVFKPDPLARRRVRQELGVSEDALLIGLIARLHPMKDHETFFKAARLLAEKRPEVHFLLAGAEISPKNPELSRMVREYNLDRHGHLLGARQDVPALTAALDIATSSSAFGEGFSNVLGEAMACGVPCVVTDVGDSAAIIGDTGKVVPPRSPEKLASAWLELIELGRPGRLELGAKARKCIEDRFHLKHVVAQYQTLYESLSVKK